MKLILNKKLLPTKQRNSKTKVINLDCPFDFTSRCTIGRCSCKPKIK